MQKACVWCNKRGDNVKQIEISGPNRVFFGPKAGTALVHAEHEDLFNGFNMRVEKHGHFLL